MNEHLGSTKTYAMDSYNGYKPKEIPSNSHDIIINVPRDCKQLRPIAEDCDEIAKIYKSA